MYAFTLLHMYEINLMQSNKTHGKLYRSGDFSMTKMVKTLELHIGSEAHCPLY